MRDRATPTKDTDPRPGDRREADSTELCGPAGYLVVWHQGERYVLRVTRNDRLILTKEP